MFGPREIMNETVAFVGEFIGTFLFLFFAYAGAQTVNHAADQTATPETKNIPNLDNLMFISIIFGFSLMVNVWIFFRISGGMFNPVVTMALYMVGAFPILRGIVVVGAQIAGGISAAALVKFLIPGGREVRHTVSLGDGTSVLRGLFIEMLLTAELIFTILMLAAEKSKTTFIAPIGIGFALFIGHLVGITFTGAGLNPARAFGSAVISGDFPSYHWLYWVGPVMGGLLAVIFFKIMKFLRYEDANGDQDKAAYEPESLEHFVQKNVKRASLLMDETAKRASWVSDKAAAAFHEMKHPVPNVAKRRGPTVFTGDTVPLVRRPATAGSYAKRTPVGSPRYRPDWDPPKQPHPQPQPHRFNSPPTPLSRSSSQRTYVEKSPEQYKKHPISTIYSVSPHSSPSSSILNMTPPIPPIPASFYDNRHEIPIGIGPRIDGYVQENPQENRGHENFPFVNPLKDGGGGGGGVGNVNGIEAENLGGGGGGGGARYWNGMTQRF